MSYLRQAREKADEMKELELMESLRLAQYAKQQGVRFKFISLVGRSSEGVVKAELQRLTQEEEAEQILYMRHDVAEFLKIYNDENKNNKDEALVNKKTEKVQSSSSKLLQDEKDLQNEVTQKPKILNAIKPVVPANIPEIVMAKEMEN